MTLYTDTFTTPFGAFSTAVTETGALAATAFGQGPALVARLRKCDLITDVAAGREARTQILAYLAGERETFELELAADGSAFQQNVWAALRRIPFGKTRSYGDLARELKSSPRAVGRANATNPICLIVPCHRVIGADGSLTGFAFGEAIKRKLLELEGAFASV
jgi:methylated-DNA-[protein]-cysteine S-methyltransferase